MKHFQTLVDYLMFCSANMKIKGRLQNRFFFCFLPYLEGTKRCKGDPRTWSAPWVWGEKTTVSFSYSKFILTRGSNNHGNAALEWVPHICCKFQDLTVINCHWSFTYCLLHSSDNFYCTLDRLHELFNVNRALCGQWRQVTVFNYSK